MEREDNLMCRGQKFSLVDPLDRFERVETYMLCNTAEAEYRYVISCVEGCHAGVIYGFVRPEPNRGVTDCVSWDHLKGEIEEVFPELNWDTFRLL